jgi:hypothetical protein
MRCRACAYEDRERHFDHIVAKQGLDVSGDVVRGQKELVLAVRRSASVRGLVRFAPTASEIPRCREMT